MNRSLLALSLVVGSGLFAADAKSAKQSAPCTLFDPNEMSKSYGVWLESDLLFWKSNMGQLGLALESDSATSLSRADVKNLDYKWDWGFRLGLGYKLPHDKWDIFLNYTYLNAFAERTLHAPDGGALFPTWIMPFGLPNGYFATVAKGKWNTHLNMADMDLGRNCFVGKWLTIRPFIGVRALFIDQNFTVKYQGGTAVPVGDTDRNVMKNDFWGVGLRLGGNSLWGLGCGFSIYGDASAALLSGNFKIHEKDSLNVAHLTRGNVTNKVRNVVATADLALGLQYDYLFCKDRYHFGAKLGWEFNVFFNQDQYFRFLGNTGLGPFVTSQEDLAFQGITLGLRFDF